MTSYLESRGILSDYGTCHDHDQFYLVAEGCPICEVVNRNKSLKEALAEMVYEVTHLSPEEDDGSHWCKISKATLTKARDALAQ